VPWENLVSACRACNHRKGGKTLEEAHMRLIARPRRPGVSSYLLWLQHLQEALREEWRRYLPLPVAGATEPEPPVA